MAENGLNRLVKPRKYITTTNDVSLTNPTHIMSCLQRIHQKIATACELIHRISRNVRDRPAARRLTRADPTGLAQWARVASICCDFRRRNRQFARNSRASQGCGGRLNLSMYLTYFRARATSRWEHAADPLCEMGLFRCIRTQLVISLSWGFDCCYRVGTIL